MGKGISVIIRNRNEADYIGFAIQSVLDHIDVDNREIIVCDNESTDDSMYVVSLFSDRIPIRTVTVTNEEYTPGRVLNPGLGLAKYDCVLVLSAHCQITQLPDGIIDWPTAPHHAVFGKQIPIYRGKKISRRYIWANFSDDSNVVNRVAESEDRVFLHNAFCFYNRRTVLDQPFDETLSGKEDRYWAAEYVANGGQILYSSELECNHFYTGNGATWKGIG